MTASADDDVIKNLDPKELAGADENPRHLNVCLRRLRFTAWVVVLCGVTIYVQLAELEATTERASGLREVASKLFTHS